MARFGRYFAPSVANLKRASTLALARLRFARILIGKTAFPHFGSPLQAAPPQCWPYSRKSAPLVPSAAGGLLRRDCLGRRSRSVQFTLTNLGFILAGMSAPATWRTLMFAATAWTMTEVAALQCGTVRGTPMISSCKRTSTGDRSNPNIDRSSFWNRLSLEKSSGRLFLCIRTRRMRRQTSATFRNPTLDMYTPRFPKNLI